MFCSLQPLSTPVWPVGNDSGGECGVATARRFIMPGAYLDAAKQEAANHGSSINSPFWYSFDYGSVHFVMLSTEHDVTPGSHQYRVSNWLCHICPIQFGNLAAASSLYAAATPASWHVLQVCMAKAASNCQVQWLSHSTVMNLSICPLNQHSSSS